MATVPQFYYDAEHDTNDGKEWSDMDLEDLRNTLARGGSIEDVAIFLCRGGTQDEVRKKAEEMGRWGRLSALGRGDAGSGRQRAGLLGTT